MNKKGLTILLISLIGLSLLMSFARLTYNYYKYVSEELYLYTKSDDEKRKIYFGELHDFSMFVISKTSNRSKIMFYDPDPRSFFLVSYYVYPRLIFPGRVLSDAKTILTHEKIEYILYYGTEKKWIEQFPSYINFASFNDKEKTTFGLLLRKK